jgi:acyl carrier protein
LSETDRDLTGRYVAPRTDTERALAEVWTQLLAVDRVGVDDDFFAELGGHSLLATQLISRVRDLFRIDVPLGLIFETPTIAGLAKSIESMRAGADSIAAPPIRRLTRERQRVDLSSIAKRGSAEQGGSPARDDIRRDRAARQGQ